MGAKHGVVEDNVQNSVQNNERLTSVSDGEYKDVMLNPTLFFGASNNTVKFSGRIINGLRQGYGKTVFENNPNNDSFNFTEYAFYDKNYVQGKCLRISISDKPSDWIEYRNGTEKFIVYDKSYFISFIAYQSVCKKITTDERYTYTTTTYPDLLTTDVFVTDTVTGKYNNFTNLLFVSPRKLLEGLYPTEYDYLKNPELIGRQNPLTTEIQEEKKE